MKNTTLLLLLFLFFSSCSDNPEYVITNFTITNESGNNLDLFITGYADPNRPGVYMDTTLQIDNNVSLVNRYSTYSPASAYPFPFGGGTDSISIIFNDTIIVSYIRDDTSARNPLIFENYAGGKVSEGLYEYFYTITEEDYENALANY